MYYLGLLRFSLLEACLSFLLGLNFLVCEFILEIFNFVFNFL